MAVDLGSIPNPSAPFPDLSECPLEALTVDPGLIGIVGCISRPLSSRHVLTPRNGDSFTACVFPHGNTLTQCRLDKRPRRTDYAWPRIPHGTVLRIDVQHRPLTRGSCPQIIRPSVWRTDGGSPCVCPRSL